MASLGLRPLESPAIGGACANCKWKDSESHCPLSVAGEDPWTPPTPSERTSAGVVEELENTPEPAEEGLAMRALLAGLPLEIERRRQRSKKRYEGRNKRAFLIPISLAAVKPILRYLKGSKSQALFYRHTLQKPLYGFFNSDWTGKHSEEAFSTTHIPQNLEQRRKMSPRSDRRMEDAARTTKPRIHSECADLH